MSIQLLQQSAAMSAAVTISLAIVLTVFITHRIKTLPENNGDGYGDESTADNPYLSMLTSDEMLYAKYGGRGKFSSPPTSQSSSASWRKWPTAARRRYLNHVRSHIARPVDRKEWQMIGRKPVNWNRVTCMQRRNSFGVQDVPSPQILALWCPGHLGAPDFGTSQCKAMMNN